MVVPEGDWRGIRNTYDGSQEEPIVGRLDDPLWVVEATYHRSLHRPLNSYRYWSDGSWGKVDKERVWGLQGIWWASSLLPVHTQGIGMAVASGDGIAGEAKSHASHKMGMVVAAGDGIAGEAKSHASHQMEMAVAVDDGTARIAFGQIVRGGANLGEDDEEEKKHR